MNESLIVDHRTDQPLGYFWEASEAGFQIISKHAIPANRVYYLRLPTVDKDVLKARSVWCTQREDKTCFDTGFQIMETNPMALKKMLFILTRCVKQLNITITRTTAFK